MFHQREDNCPCFMDATYTGLNTINFQTFFAKRHKSEDLEFRI